MCFGIDCKSDLRKGDLFVLSCAIVRRGSISSELLMWRCTQYFVIASRG